MNVVESRFIREHLKIAIQALIAAGNDNAVEIVQHALVQIMQEETYIKIEEKTNVFVSRVTGRDA